MSNLYTHRSPCHLILFFTLFLSLSHLSPFHLSFTSSSPTPPPHLSISLNSSSSMGFSTLCLFISHGIFPLLFTSPIDCTINLLFKLYTTHCPNNWWCCAWIFFFLPPMLLWWFVYEKCKIYIFHEFFHPLPLHFPWFCDWSCVLWSNLQHPQKDQPLKWFTFPSSPFQ